MGREPGAAAGAPAAATKGFLEVTGGYRNRYVGCFKLMLLIK